MATITENLQTIKNSTSAIKQAILDKGGEVGDLTTYADAITNLPSGEADSNPTAEKNNVTFYDYDGTIRYSYTADEFLALTEMPPLPTQPGLICQEWNWSFEDAMEYVAEYGVLDIGATYITDDGKTRLYIRIAAEGRMDVPLYFQQTIANGVTIDWGDGSATETLEGTGKVNTIHRYASVGDYVISLDVAEGTLNFGHGVSNISMIGNTDQSIYLYMLYKVEIGYNVVFNTSYTFVNNLNLISITLPAYVSKIASNFSTYTSIKTLVIPSKVTNLQIGLLTNNTDVRNIIVPAKAKLAAQGFRSLSMLSNIILPLVESIPTLCFSGDKSLTNVVFPRQVLTINDNSFSSCDGMIFYDFSHHTAVPTLTNTGAFTNIPSDCKIIVPDNLYDEWVAATNWSAYATYIIKKSEWDNLKQGGSL